LAAAETGDGSWTNERVDALVERLFLSEEARRETNLQFVRDSVMTSPQCRQLLTLYRQVYQGKEVADDERSLDQNRLKLFGLLRAEQGVLRVRNEIYHRVFNLAWIKANMPVNWTRRIAVISTLLVFVLAAVAVFLFYYQGERAIAAQAQVAMDNFRQIPSPDVRLTSLAELFGLPGYEDQARQLFRQELGPEEQLALFDLANPQEIETPLITVVKGLYTNLENNEHDNQLLQAMAQPLEKLDDPMAINLATEIEQLLQGRAYQAQGEYQQAVMAYDIAIGLNDRNPVTYFDRGLTYAALDEPSQALADFERVLSLDGGWQERVRQAVINDSQLYTVLWSERDVYKLLTTSVPTPTGAP
jgi:tetratricopeptide (TPR) repeat protein